MPVFCVSFLYCGCCRHKRTYLHLLKSNQYLDSLSVAVVVLYDCDTVLSQIVMDVDSDSNSNEGRESIEASLEVMSVFLLFISQHPCGLVYFLDRVFLSKCTIVSCTCAVCDISSSCFPSLIYFLLTSFSLRLSSPVPSPCFPCLYHFLPTIRSVLSFNQPLLCT